MALGTAVAIAGIAGQAIGTGLSFAQAMGQKKAMASADAKAANYMAKARERLEVNYMDELAINKEPYQRQREAMLVAGAQAQQASVEGSTRGAAANTGRILAAQQQAQGDIRDQMNRDMFNLEAASAEEDSRLRDINTQLDMGEISGAQQQSAQASAARQQAIQQGIQGAINTVEGVIAMPELYRKTKTKTDTVADGLIPPNQLGGGGFTVPNGSNSLIPPNQLGGGGFTIPNGSNSLIPPNQLGGGGFTIPNGSNRVNPFDFNFPTYDMYGRPVN